MTQIRSMKDAYQEIKNSDPDTAITYYMFRKMVLSGEIPSLKSNGKYLLRLSDVKEYFEQAFFNESVKGAN